MDKEKKESILEYYGATGLLNGLDVDDSVYAYIEKLTEVAGVNQDNNIINIEKRKILAELYHTEMIKKTTSDMIESNRELAASNDKHGKIIVGISLSMAFLGLAQVVVAILQLIIK